MRLRDYQQDLLNRVQAALEPEKARVMMQLPTGGGKTVIAGALLNDWLNDRRKAAWLTHRKELARQTCKMLTEQGVTAYANPVWRRGTSAPAWNDTVTILMAQTVGRRTSESIVWDRYGAEDLMIVDESHHTHAKGWERAVVQWPGRVLGMTATPWRLMKKEGFDHLFNDLICGPQVVDLQEDGSLCDVSVLMPSPEEMIIGGAVRAGDYTETGIERANSGRDVMTAGAVRFWKAHASERQTIVYAVSQQHARNLLKVFKDEGVQAAELLGDTPSEERARAVGAFERGYLQVLVNLQVATEGFDLPDASCVLITRPTLSLALYLQMVGRGLRPKDSGANCLILDLAGNSITHGLPDDRRQWSLQARGEQSFGDAPVQRCDECGAVSPASRHDCRNCSAPFGRVCERCGKFRWWSRWEFEDHCGDVHDVVCDFCHNDAHVQANIPQLDELSNLVEPEESSMYLSNELTDGLTPLLQELLEQERNMVVAREESKRSELFENIQRRKALLSDDERLDSEFTAYVDALPEDGQPQSRPQERRLFNEWESGLKNDLTSWQSALAGIQNQPNAPIVFSNAQRKLVNLLSDVAEEMGLRPSAARAALSGSSSATPSGGIVPNDSGWVSLSEFDSKPSEPRPVELQFPDGSTTPVAAQRELLIETVRWLDKAGVLTEAQCPIRSGYKNYIVSLTPEHSDGSSFSDNDQRPIGPYYVNTKLPYPQLVRATRTVIERVGLDTAAFQVRLH